ncbi:Lrp/AsnC family transcriptional regulator [Streptomyces sp. NPDC059679]|uniref:Lrp/AsnC family transcriptional regulator n=1 Tax=Streptomyces sp. NPDC059679 TaxID=3346903 RepID=UPI003678D5A8
MATLDPTDWHLLALLQNDARLGYRELARRVGLSPPAVAARVRRLESLQVITGYGARIDPVKAGWPVQAFIVLSTNGVRQSHQTAHIAQAAPHVLEDHRVTGADDHILRVVARDIGALEPLIDQLNELGKPATCFVLSSPKAWAPVPPPATSG